MKLDGNKINILLVSIGFVLLTAYLVHINSKIDTINSALSPQTLAMGQYIQTQHEKEYNELKEENDYYTCMNNARVMYELFWNNHCQERQKEPFCLLDQSALVATRDYYDKAQSECQNTRIDKNKK